MTTSKKGFFPKKSSRVASTATAAILILLGTLPEPVKALTLVTERAALGGNDLLDWSSLGKVFNPLAPDPTAFLPNSFSGTSGRGLGLNVEIPFLAGVSPPFVLQTLPFPFGIPTNFASGDFILFTGSNPKTFPAAGNPGPLTITFDTPVLGAGTQITVDDTPKFKAFISAFDADNNPLGTFSVLGTSSTALDNSALFLGILSDGPKIKKLVYSASVPKRALGINSVSLVRVSVPEPSSLWGLLAFGALGAGGWQLRKKQ